MNSPSDERLQALAAAVADVLSRKGWMLATAESCTGGWIAKICTDLAGSSAWFERGFVTYTNEAKQELLEVQGATLATHGAVSEATAREMAEGALAHSRARVSLAVSGIAGPGGATPDKPVGTVCFAWMVEGRAAASERCLFDGDRDAVRRQAVARALEGVLKQCDE